jgi:hypothetical protein
MVTSRSQTYAPNRSFVAGKLASNFLAPAAVIGIGLGLLLAIAIHEGGTNVHYRWRTYNVPVIGTLVGVLLVVILVLGMRLIARLRVRVELDPAGGKLKVVNLFRTRSYEVGGIERVVPWRFVQLSGPNGVHLYLPCLAVVGKPSTSGKRHLMKVLASISNGTTSPLLDDVQSYCSMHSIPCSLDGMVFDKLSDEQSRLSSMDKPG